MRNGVIGFIAHVGETKGLTSDFAIAGINHDVMFFSEITCEFEHVNPAIVPHAGERF